MSIDNQQKHYHEHAAAGVAEGDKAMPYGETVTALGQQTTYSALDFTNR